VDRVQRFIQEEVRFMKTVIITKTVIAGLIAGCFALAASGVSGQSSDAAKLEADAKAAAKAKQAEDFAAKQKALQDASKSSASSAGTKPSSEAKKYKPSGKDTVETMQSNQSFKGSKPVDKNAKATAPVKDVKQMTPEERAQRRQEIAKEAKP
jgi:hypothetical protein